MPIRYPGVILTSLAMALHAAIVGRYLESVFFIVAFCWAWVAVTAYRDRLQSAQSMVLTMMVLLLFVVLPLSALRLASASLAAYLSLAIMPGIISWACMFIYIRHVSQRDENEEDVGFSGAWLSAGDMTPFERAELEPTALPTAIVSTMPAPANDQSPRHSEDRGEPTASAELTLERVTEIVASLRTPAASRDAA